MIGAHIAITLLVAGFLLFNFVIELQTYRPASFFGNILLCYFLICVLVAVCLLPCLLKCTCASKTTGDAQPCYAWLFDRRPRVAMLLGAELLLFFVLAELVAMALVPPAFIGANRGSGPMAVNVLLDDLSDEPVLRACNYSHKIDIGKQFFRCSAIDFDDFNLLTGGFNENLALFEGATAMAMGALQTFLCVFVFTVNLQAMMYIFPNPVRMDVYPLKQLYKKSEFIKFF